MEPLIRRIIRHAAALAILALCAVQQTAFAASLVATTLVVTNLNDSGPGSLRESVASAGNGDVVVFDPALTAGGPVTLTLAGVINFYSDITLTGPGAELLSISTTSGRLFWVSSSKTVTIEHLTLRDGSVPTGTQGGAILHNGTLLTVRHCRIMNCVADYGGGIAANSPLVMEDTEVLDCSAGTSGGGVYTGDPDGTLEATRCVFRDNVADEFGGGLGCFGPSTVLSDCLISGNTVVEFLAGGIYSSKSTQINRCTISDNTAPSAAGGYIWTGTTNTSNVINSTISGNVATGTSGIGGLHLDGTMPFVLTHVTVTGNTGNGVGGLSAGIPPICYLRGCIIAGNQTGAAGWPDITEGVLSDGYNLIGNVGGVVFNSNGAGDIYGDPMSSSMPNAGATEFPNAIDPVLAPLTPYSRHVKVHPPLAGSPAIDAANPVTALSMDQRRRVRPVGLRADMGAYEATPVRLLGWSDFDTNDWNQPDGFGPLGFQSSLAWADYSTTECAYRAYVTPNPSRFRMSGIVSNPGLWIPYASVGSTNVVRAKFHVYAAGQTNPSAINQIPNLRMRLAVRYAQTSMLEVYSHVNSDPAAQPLANEIAPSRNPARPSVYRVDLDPVDVPFLATTPDEGIMVGFEAFSQDPQDCGYVALTEASIGVYPAFMAISPAVPPLRTWTPSASDAGDLGQAAAEASLLRYSVTASTTQGQFPTTDFGVFPAYSESAAGVTMDSTAFDNTPSGLRVGIALRDFTPGASRPARVRIMPQMQYAVSYHVTSTQPSNRNCQFRMRARCLRYNWSQKLEIGGAKAAGTNNNIIAEQMLPGLGCLNPDKDGIENGGWYNLLVHSPLHPDVRADLDGDITLRMPQILAQPGPGVDAASLRDLRIAADLIDTLSFGGMSPLEAGNFTIDRIELRAAPVVEE